ncbi:terpene synthase family protein [Actinomadura sp. ATCC 31491]|uniref:Terpene synthase family protein n=1 Tax=Actinomadura luzonensis TaxID=2805427 RepID=A0ABT0FXT9_9ACTN|nr:terpene synthase family protein [Actinomadura luzonensis]MCK2217163.1 terpene synthase family protein [Actinomadura luzonensis]
MSDSSPAYFTIHNQLADRLLDRSHQLAGVPAGDRDAVLATALDAVPRAAALLRPYNRLFPDGDSSASRLAFSCLSAAATFPRADAGRVADLGTLTTILFGVDDIADGITGGITDGPAGGVAGGLTAGSGGVSPDGVAELFDRMAAALAGSPPPTGDGPVGEALRAWSAWCERWYGHAASAGYAPVLADQLSIAGAAMARERAWATGERPWPGYEPYLANGRITILYHAWWLAALPLCGPPGAPEEHWRALEPVLDLGAACLRLANDLRTFERERREGKPNAVLILERGGLDVPAAVERVKGHLAGLGRELAAGLAALPAALAGAADGQRRSVAFNGGWYLARDTHAYTVRDLARDAEGHRG